MHLSNKVMTFEKIMLSFILKYNFFYQKMQFCLDISHKYFTAKAPIVEGIPN